MIDRTRFPCALATVLRRESCDHPFMPQAVVWALQGVEPELPPPADRLADDIEDYLAAEGLPLRGSVNGFTSPWWRSTVRLAIGEALQ